MSKVPRRTGTRLDRRSPRTTLVVRSLRPYRVQGSALFLLVLVDIVAVTVNPLIATRFVDLAAAGEEAGELYRLAVLYLLISVAALVVGMAAGRLMIDLAQRCTNDIRLDLVDHVLQLDHDTLTRIPTGDLLERIDGDTTTLERYLALFVFDVLAALLLSATVLVVALLSDVRLGAALVVGGVVALVCVVRSQGIARPWLRAERRAHSDLAGFVFERLSVREEIRSAAAENYTVTRLREPLAVLKGAMSRAGAGLRLSSSALELGVVVAITAVLAVGGYLIDRDSVELGAIFLAYQYIGVLTGALYRVSMRLGDLASASGSLDRIQELLALPRADRSAVAQLPPSPGLEFDRVGFSYDGTRAALLDVSFRVPVGTSVGLIGASGSGKSTASGMIWRAHDPDEGQVLLGGIPSTQLSAQALRSNVGVVPQETYMFHASLRENITVFDDTIADARIDQALAAVGLAAWVSTLPAGLDTSLDGDGATLSTGQRHLLAIARVLVRDPAIVVLDEVTSQLDPDTMRVVHSAMVELMSGRTSVVVTHSRVALDLVDQVVVLSSGSVVWQGPRTEVPSNVLTTLLKAVE